MSPITLIAIGLVWFSWERTIEAIPATLFSLGVALLALMLLVVVAYSSDNSQVFGIGNRLHFFSVLSKPYRSCTEC